MDGNNDNEWNNVDSEKCPPLPQKIVDLIFSYLQFHLNQNKYRQRLRSVCHAWKVAIDSKYPLQIIVNNESHHWTLNSTRVSLAKVVNFTKEVQMPIMFAETIQYIIFKDIVISYNLIALLSTCRQVEWLTFLNITLDIRREIQCPPEGLSLPNVTCLCINMKACVYFDIEELVLITFLKNIEFGQLELVFINGKTRRAVFEDGLDFQNTLKLEISTNKNQDLPPGIKKTALMELIIKNSKSLKHFGISSYHFQPFGFSIEDYRGELPKIQLTSMSGCFLQEPSPFIKNSLLLLEAQNNLERIFDIHTDAYSWPSLISAIQRNKSLTDLGISFRVNFPGLENLTPVNNLDMSVFGNCSNLKHLYFNNYNIPMFNLDRLPQSITSLSSNSFLSTEELLTIASRLTKLKSFNWTFNENHQDAAVFNLTVLQTFARIISLEWISLPKRKMDHDNIIHHYTGRDEIKFSQFEVHREVGMHVFIICCFAKTFDHAIP